ncbi:hypothetical protein ACSBOB_22320 [Mesorhizobium sp. ASY16-5R]|uniref:hypothetical protein n=1 Tax=Mesorhizobium sp. ASY16-5R TaxID=3445772 RepID=UPI003FA15935
MNWNEELKAEREVLKRVIALFFSLARLADLAAGHCYPVRRVVLWILRRAEPVAWDCIANTGGAWPACVDPPPLFPVLRRNSRADADYFALIFRTAARALQSELRIISNLSVRDRAENASDDRPARFAFRARFARQLLAALPRPQGTTGSPRLDTS